MQPSDKRFFFCHIPKTAGTAFRESLWDQFPGESMFPSRSELRESKSYVPWKELKDDEALRSRQIDLLSGHYPIGAGIVFFDRKDVQVITFVRPGTERAISHLRHFQRRTPDKAEQFLASALERGAGPFVNTQTKWLSGYRGKGKLGPEHLARAKKKLTRCAFVGLSDQFTASIAIANGLFGWSLRDLRANEAPDGQEHPEEAIVERLRELNHMDEELYAFAEQLPCWVGHRVGASSVGPSSGVAAELKLA